MYQRGNHSIYSIYHTILALLHAFGGCIFLPELINSLGFNAGPILSAEMMLSMICLIITCVIYLKLPELRNVPGKIVISICSCLFFTYLFLIMDFSMRKSGNSISCMVIGFFVHFSFMAVFIWTNVMSFDIWKTLKCTQPGKVSESEQTRRFIKYSIYSWIISLVLTVPVFVFDNIEAIPEYYKPKFGRKRCWLSGTTAFLIYFNLPVGLTLFANLIFFVHTVIVLRRLKEQTKMLNVKRNENRLRLSLKLLVIMGLIWFTEYLPWITGVYPLYLLSGMLTCLYDNHSKMSGIGGIKWKSESGCCICGNKTSSSRFTSSLKYESEFAGCFLLNDNRSGEICNPCVLCIKRYRQVLPGSGKNWKHFVDSRKGPGNKSTMRKIRSKTIKKSARRFLEASKILKDLNCQRNRSRLESKTLQDISSKETSRRKMAQNKIPIKLSSSIIDPLSWKSFLTPLHLDNPSGKENQRSNKYIKKSPPFNLRSFKKHNICCQTVYASHDGVVLLDKMNKWCERTKENGNYDDNTTERRASDRPRNLLFKPLDTDFVNENLYCTSNDSLSYSPESEDKDVDLLNFNIKESSLECDASSGYSSIGNSPDHDLEENQF
ncbi:G-protein coupled receptor Mth2 [Nymphon striatum]|nr:G-protein coupled receptor Mth2 [Nymphon striatum]